MRVHSEQLKHYKISVTKVKRNKKTGNVILLFTVDRGVRVYERHLEHLGYDTYAMNYNGDYLEMEIKF